MEAKETVLKRVVAWLMPLLFLLIGGIFYICVSGCSFLGIVFCGVAAICVVEKLLKLGKDRKAVRLVRFVWKVLVILVVIAALITVIPVLQGPENTSSESEYLIVLGAGVRGTEPSEILSDRIQKAAEYMKEHPEVICIATGGKGSDENISEAQCIYEHLTAMGIDGNRIWLEDQATSTIENFRYSIALITEKTGKTPERVTVMSNEFHLYRASLMATDCGLEADFAAAPTSKPLIRISYTIREIFALWKYLTIGG